MTADDPFALFAVWYADASRASIEKPHAMFLATADNAGRSSSRVVLLSSYDDRGFVFHTNYASKKGEEIAANARVSLVFWWDPLRRQVRIEGRAEPTSAAESDAYFAQRPRGSQLSAWASDQSRPIPSHAWLEERMHALEQKYAGQVVPRPPHWGGYRVMPEVFEFWEDRADRLHERIRHERDPQGRWRTVRLAP
jgi:pyridoxamine 5'-phosphate oxidase